MALLWILLAILLIIVSILCKIKSEEVKRLKEELENIRFSHKSNVVKHGKSFEQLFPYMKNYPYDPCNFRFLGSPIDGVSFEDDEIVFVEFKTGSSKLSSKQKIIRDLINSKKIKWKEIRDK